MVGKSILFSLLGLLILNRIQASSLEAAAGFFKQMLTLESVGKNFEQKYPQAPNLICKSCKTEMTYGAIVGNVVAEGLMTALKGGNAENIRDVANALFQALSTKKLIEINECMLDAVKTLQIKCSECAAINWEQGSSS